MKSLFKMIGMIFVMAIIGFSMAGCDPDGGTDEFTVKFDKGDGGGNAPTDRTVQAGKKITLPGQGDMTAPTDKEFKGWESSGQSYNADAEYTVTADVTFIAQWETAEAGDPVPFTVTVTGLGSPSNNLWGVSLMTGTTRDTVVATANNAFGSSDELFTLYVPYENGLMAGAPDTTQPFAVAGEYYIGLSDVNIQNRDDPANAFILCDDNDLPIKVTFNAGAPAHTYQKAEFKPASNEPGGTPLVVPFKLIINNLGTPVNNSMGIWGASLMDNNISDIVAVGMLSENNTFTFYEPDATGAPDTSKPFGNNGNYYIGLSDVDLMNPTNPANLSMLYNGDQLARLTFNNTKNTQTVEKENFKSGTQFKVIVSETAGNNNYSAWLLTDTEDPSSVVAVRTYKKDGSFDFLHTGTGTAVIDLNKPFMVNGEYYIYLDTPGSTKSPNFSTALIYCENSIPKKVTFSADSPVHTISLDDFEPVTTEQ